MNKRISTIILAGILSAGISMMSGLAEANAWQLTFDYGEITEKEEIIFKQLLTEYTDQTGINIEIVSEEADVSIRSYSETEEAYQKGKICNLYPFMENKNPYNVSETWGTELPDEIWDRIQVYEKEIPGYPAARTIARIFCNEEIFRKAGLEIPETWSEFMTVCSKLQADGIEPFVFPEKDASVLPWQWMLNSLCSQMANNLPDMLDETDDHFVELAEACKGVDKGLIDFTQPQIQVALECMKDFYNFCLKSGTDVNYENSLEIFARGEAAMVLALNQDMDKLERQFSCQAFPIPAVTVESSQFASGMHVQAGGEGARFYSIASACTKDKELFDIAVDFVEYMTSVQVQEKMALEAGILPSSPNAELPEKMKMFQVKEEVLKMSYFTGLDEQNKNEIWEYLTKYMQGKLELASLAEMLNESCQRAANRICEENDWNLVNNYGLEIECSSCAP